MLLFDTEANGLLRDVTKDHCLVIRDTETQKSYRFRDVKSSLPKAGTFADGLDLLDAADLIGGHNVLGYDLPMLKKLRKWKPRAKLIRDSLVYSRLLFPDMKERDFARDRKKGGAWIPRHLFGRHSLEAWGHRLGEHKGDFKGPWDKWTPEMEDYCEQDTVTGMVVMEYMLRRAETEGIADAECIEIEHGVAAIIARQVARGFAFNTKKAAKLYATLAEKRTQIETTLKTETFPPFYTDCGEFVPKRDNKKAGYVEGVPLCKVELMEFNPGSRLLIANRLSKVYGWKPKAFTEDGRPQVDESILSALPYQPCSLLVEYLTIDKRIGQLAEGREAWLKAERNGVVYGDVNPNAAVTGRMTHSKPNIGQVPAVYSPYGKECRELFHARPPYKQVGCDADALELRDLAGYMAKWDDGAYVKTVLEGKKEDGTDMHSVNCRGLGYDPTMALPWVGPKATARDMAKTWFYAFIYGAGDFKLGLILLDMMPKDKRPKGKQAVAGLGRQSRQRIAKGLPALGKFITAVKRAALSRGYLIGLDGRKLHVRSEHAAPNTLLQSAGAIQMKKALLIADAELQKRYRCGDDYEFIANVHDEWQVEALPKIADKVGKILADSIRLAGEHFKFRCPLAGNYKIGTNWAETH